MSPVPIGFLIFLEQALERASLAGWQRGTAVSLPSGPCGSFLLMEHRRHLSGEQSEVCAMQYLGTWSSMRSAWKSC